MRDHVLICGSVWLGLSFPLVPIADGCRAFGAAGQDSPKKAANERPRCA